MDERMARWYAGFTRGQLVAFLHDDGNWYLYAPDPVDAAALVTSDPVESSGSS